MSEHNTGAIAARYCAGCGAAASQDVTQKFCIACGRSLIPTCISSESTQQQGYPTEVFQPPRPKTPPTTQLIILDGSPLAHRLLSGEAERARQTSTTATRAEAAADVASAGGRIPSIKTSMNVSQKPIGHKDGKKSAKREKGQEVATCEARLWRGTYIPEKENEEDRYCQHWEHKGRFMATLPLIEFENVREYIEIYIIGSFPDQYKPHKTRMMGRGWTLAVDVDKKTGPLLLSRDGKDLRSGHELVQHLSTGKGQCKVLNLCWEEPDEKLSSDYHIEHPSIPVSRIVSAEARKQTESGSKKKVKSEPDLETNATPGVKIKPEPGVKIKPGPGVKIKPEPGVKIKPESGSQPTQERPKRVPKRGGKQQSTDTETLDLSGQIRSKRTLSDAFSERTNQAIVEADISGRSGMVTRKSKQLQAFVASAGEEEEGVEDEDEDASDVGF